MSRLWDVTMRLRDLTDVAYLNEAYNELGEYTRAEEQGRLIIMPVKFGDTLYEPYKNGMKVLEWRVSELRVTEKGEMYILASTLGPEINLAKLGDTLFTTKEEAEEKLKEMQNGNID